MSLSDWAKRSSRYIRERGYPGVKDSTYELYKGFWRYFGWHVPRGTNVYERDWEVLVVLDACRVDLMEEVADEYPFLGHVDKIKSVGSMSEEWLAKTFSEEYSSEVSETIYVTTNAFSGEVLTPEKFRMVDELWRYCWDDELGTVPPSSVTDRAVSIAREHDPARLIVHYMQPHHPFIGSDLFGRFGIDQFGEQKEATVVDALRNSDISPEEFWIAYRDNLRYVLDETSVLLSNIDADKVVITSDHGDALGEWGIYGHPAGCLHPAVTNVPWVETSASDTGSYEPEIEPRAEADTTVEERLEELGYL